MNKLVQHLESYLGMIVHGWDNIPDLLGTKVQIVQYDSREHGAELVLSTMGLSRHPLKNPLSYQTIYLELIVFANNPSMPMNLPSVLAQTARALVKDGRALLRGEILGPSGKIIGDSDMEALYVSLPGVLPPEFAIAEDDDNHRIALVWLMPITAKEATWAKAHGWDKFEEKLGQQQPDALDWYREELRL